MFDSIWTSLNLLFLSYVMSLEKFVSSISGQRPKFDDSFQDNYSSFNSLDLPAFHQKNIQEVCAEWRYEEITMKSSIIEKHTSMREIVSL